MFMRKRARAPLAVSIGCSLLMMAVASPPAHASEKNCANQIAERQQEEEKRIDQTKAVSLAKAAPEFEPRTRGYKAEFNSIHFIHSFDPKSCSYLGLDSVNVVYSLSSADKPAKNVVAHLDAGLKNVKELSEHAADRVFTIDATSNVWSGYVAAAVKSSGTGYEKLSTVNVKWTVPTIDSPDTGDTACMTASCDVGVWAGMYGAETSSSGEGYLAQTGSNSSRACSWEISANWFDAVDIGFKCKNSHYLWYEFLPSAPVKCTDATVSAGNSVSAEVKKWSANNSYTMTVSNLTTGKSCSVTQKYGQTTPYYGAFIVEPPATSNTGEATKTLPSFSTITMSKAQVAWLQSGGGGNVQHDLYYIDKTLSPQNLAGVIRYRLHQGSALNIAVGALTSGGNFTQAYITSQK